MDLLLLAGLLAGGFALLRIDFSPAVFEEELAVVLVDGADVVFFARLLFTRTGLVLVIVDGVSIGFLRDDGLPPPVWDLASGSASIPRGIVMPVI